MEFLFECCYNKCNKTLRKEDISMEQIKALKSHVGKFLVWSSSKYNAKKSVVVTDIIQRVNVGSDTEIKYIHGSCSPRGSLLGGSYILKIKDGKATLENPTTKAIVEILPTKKETELPRIIPAQW